MKQIKKPGLWFLNGTLAVEAVLFITYALYYFLVNRYDVAVLFPAAVWLRFYIENQTRKTAPSLLKYHFGNYQLTFNWLNSSLLHAALAAAANPAPPFCVALVGFSIE